MNISRRNFLGGMAAGGIATIAPGCASLCNCLRPGKVALQLYSIRQYIAGDSKKGIKGVGPEKAFADIRNIGYEAVEFAGYYGKTSQEILKILNDNGLRACGTHVSNDKLGFDVQNWKFNADVLKETCEYNLGFGNNLIICPGGGNMPKGVTWAKQRDVVPSKEIDEFTKNLCDLYNKAADEAAKYGCKVGLHNHQWEFFVKMTDGSTFWDYFFKNTCRNVCMEQDVGWTTCAGYDPCAQYLKYPGRSPTLHAKENGMGPDVKEFDAILGQPGKPGAKPVDWDRLFPITDADNVQWYVVECERHGDTLDAIKPSFDFLKSKGRC